MSLPKTKKSLHWTPKIQDSMKRIVAALSTAQAEAEAFPGGEGEEDLAADLKHVAGTCQLLREAVEGYGIHDEADRRAALNRIIAKRSRRTRSR